MEAEERAGVCHASLARASDTKLKRGLAELTPSYLPTLRLSLRKLKHGLRPVFGSHDLLEEWVGSSPVPSARAARAARKPCLACSGLLSACNRCNTALPGATAFYRCSTNSMQKK